MLREEHILPLRLNIVNIIPRAEINSLTHRTEKPFALLL